MKLFFIISALVLSLSAFSQTDKLVTLVVTGQGRTTEESRQNALKSAIEQAFGTFISSKIEILNDSLLKDEFVSIANGNIQKYEIIDESLLPNKNYISTLNTTVSIGNLTTFSQSKGINSEFKGGLFATNVAIQELNEKNELKSVENLYRVVVGILPQCINYKIIASEPVLENGFWAIPVKIDYYFNENYRAVADQVFKFAKSVSLNESERSNYVKLNKQVYPIKFDNGDDSVTFFFRNQFTLKRLLSMPYTFLKYCICNSSYANGFEVLKLLDAIDKFGYLNLESDEKILSVIRDGYEDSDIKLFWYDDGSVVGRDYENPKAKVEPAGYLGYRVNLGSRREPLSFRKDWFEADINNPRLGFAIPNQSDDYLLRLNIFHLNNFLSVSFSEKRTLEEIKKIFEYKVIFK